MTSRIGAAAAAVALALVWDTAAVAQEFRRGLSAYNSGDFAGAAANWQPLAEQGQAESQAALAFLFFKGLGVGQSDTKAVYWYAQAAQKGQPEAQLFLGWSYLDGSGVARDAIQSYKWCDLAYSNGAAEAALACRDMAAQRLTPEELRESIRQVNAWFVQSGRTPR